MKGFQNVGTVGSMRLPPCPLCIHPEKPFGKRSFFSGKHGKENEKVVRNPQIMYRGHIVNFNTNPKHAQKKNTIKKKLQKIDLPWFPIHFLKEFTATPKKKTPSTTERISPPRSLKLPSPAQWMIGVQWSCRWVDESFQRIGCFVLGFILVIFWKGVYSIQYVYIWTFHFGCLTWIRYRVWVHHPLGSNWQPLERSGIYILKLQSTKPNWLVSKGWSMLAFRIPRLATPVEAKFAPNGWTSWVKKTSAIRNPPRNSTKNPMFTNPQKSWPFLYQ